MSKMPDEIKKGLECCGKGLTWDETCGTGCPYEGMYITGCSMEISADALALIQQLQDDNAQLNRCIENMTDKLNAMNDEVAKLQAERDSAVADLRQASIYLCCACKKYHHAVRGVSNHYCEVIGECADFTGAISCGMFEWRGVQKEDTP